jgi:PAS domain S-box-containing protein
LADKPTYEKLEQRIKDLEIESVERKRAEEELRQSKHYFRSLLNHIHEDIMVIGQDYRITDVNKTFQVTSGRKREDVIGHYCYEISHGYNAPCEKHGEECMLRKVFETGKASIFCHQHVHAEGWKAWVDILMSPLRDEKGNVTHVIEAVREVTDLVNAGKALRESEDKYRRLVESALDWVWSVDIEGRFTFTNEAVKHLLGYEVYDIVGSPVFWSMPPEDRERFQELFQKSVEQKRGWINMSISRSHKDGSIRFLESTAQAIQDAEDRLIGFIGIDRDITKRKQAVEGLTL